MSEPEEAEFTAKELAFLGYVSERGQTMRTELVKKFVVKLPVADSLPMDGQPFTQEMRSECINNDYAVTNLLICRARYGILRGQEKEETVDCEGGCNRRGDDGGQVRG